MPTTVANGRHETRQLLTAEEFLDWLQPGVFADLIAGEIFMHSPVRLKHARLVDFMHALMKHYVELRGLGEVLSEVWAVRLDARNVFLPDICYFTPEEVAELTETHARSAPKMVVEVLSPTTGHRDVGQKFASYEHHQVDEYWVLDPHDLAHRFYRRDGEVFVEFAEGAERIDCRAIPGFWVSRRWLDPEALPPVLDCLKQVLGENAL